MTDERLSDDELSEIAIRYKHDGRGTVLGYRAKQEILALRTALAASEAKLAEREKMCGDCCGYSEADRELLYGVHLESKRKLEESEAKLMKARWALKPFASLADGYADGRDDDHRVIGAQVALKDWRIITAGDIRHAATTLKDIA